MVGTSGFEPLTSAVSKSKYSVIQQLTGYQGLPKSLIIRHPSAAKAELVRNCNAPCL